MKLQTKKQSEQEQKKQEELFRYIIERTSENCKDDNDTFFYRETLINLAPYLFPSLNEMQAVGRMTQSLNKGRKRGPVNGGANLPLGAPARGADGRTNGYV